ncbi:hypothetical protein EDC15_11019 [Acetobacter aceti NBRC 14818]|uniref:NADP oxidoreductase n=1 Tax=Acetobacter aceti NBRC 14818 TaxID=887700 RepID=A0AB33IBQ4_ACEAC|nr:NAD(P)-binding domain-containing protein [Acetobacter aceti]TCS32795.1 hypothetical protein EDC15_11019 [Acetobacter aceti NBRC 14818]BCK74792.1 NADP oxidoreductase [Acetobacter aceti NBRC 14818]GAN58087.1 NADP oxidoreductase coenzyme F420-dependent [Acetobacter aceti NBRC 14818]
MIPIMKRRHVLLAGLTVLSDLATTGKPVRAADALPTIGIIGAGHVASTLGGLWIKAGYQVMFSAQNIRNAKELAASLGPNASAGTPEEAARFGTVVLLAVPYRAIPDVGQKLAPLLQGKTVLDATNFYPFRDGSIASIADRDGAGLTTQRYFPGAHIVRGFSSIDMSVLASEAGREPPRLAIPVAGDDAISVQRVEDLVKAAGFDPVVTGPLSSSVLFQPGHPGFEMQTDAAGLKSGLGLR